MATKTTEENTNINDASYFRKITDQKLLENNDKYFSNIIQAITIIANEGDCVFDSKKASSELRYFIASCDIKRFKKYFENKNFKVYYNHTENGNFIYEQPILSW
jgi:hypothetical protein